MKKTKQRNKAIVGKRQLLCKSEPESVWQWLSWLAWNPNKTKVKRYKIAAVLFHNMGNPLTENEIAKKAGIINYCIGQSVRDLRRYIVMGENVLNIQTTIVKECGKNRPAYFIERE